MKMYSFCLLVQAILYTLVVARCYKKALHGGMLTGMDKCINHQYIHLRLNSKSLKLFC